MALGLVAYFIYTGVKPASLSVVGDRSYYQSLGVAGSIRPHNKLANDLAQSFIISMLAARKKQMVPPSKL